MLVFNCYLIDLSGPLRCGLNVFIRF